VISMLYLQWYLIPFSDFLFNSTGIYIMSESSALTSDLLLDANINVITTGLLLI
jgi:hypothetical protein